MTAVHETENRTVEEIDNRIDELKWKSLPFFERIVWKKEQVLGQKFYTKRRLKELEWFILSCNILLVLFGIFTIYSFTNPSISTGFQVFCLLVLTLFFAQKIELGMRISFLKEARFLKQLKKEIIES